MWEEVWSRVWNWGRNRNCLVQELDRGCWKGQGWTGTELGLSSGRAGAGQEAEAAGAGWALGSWGTLIPSNSYPHPLVLVSTPSLLCLPKPSVLRPSLSLFPPPLRLAHLGPPPRREGGRWLGWPAPAPANPAPPARWPLALPIPVPGPSPPLSPPPAQPPPPQVRQPGLAGPTPLPLPPGCRCCGATMLLPRPGD